jgi:hypothetical protein
MLNPYTTVAMLPMQGEPDVRAKFREQYYDENSDRKLQIATPDRPYLRNDPLFLARLWVQIGRFGRFA